MRSGNGRHRRPRQAPALVVAAGVTGSAMALPLLATGSASAADATTWDRVAECESGGQWSANFGNGMYGGLQMTQGTWERHGGLAYAPSPDLASRAQQIVVAEKALAAGAVEWATCAPIAGLANDGAAPGVDPGPAVTPPEEEGTAPESSWNVDAPSTTPATPSAPATRAPAAPAVPTAPSAPATSTAPAAPGAPATSTAPAAPGAPTAPGTPGAPTGSTGPTAPDASVLPGTPGTPGADEGDAASATRGTGKHRGDSAPEETGTTGSTVESGRHAAPADKRTGTPTATPTRTPATDGVKDSGATDTQGTSGAYTVRPGDSLSDIARQNELPGGWNALYDANRQTVGTDPDLILPGQSLDLTIGPIATAG